jgi:hypothetical protein
MENPEFYTTEEGGIYRKWSPRIRGITVHSVFFPDGKVFDAWAGWREDDIERIRKAYAAAQDHLTTMDV